MTTSVPPLKASRISKEYLGGSFKALDDVSFELRGEPDNRIPWTVRAAERQRCSASLPVWNIRRADTLEVFGKNVEGPGPDRGMIFQAYTSFPWLTALQERRIRDEDSRDFGSRTP